MTDDKKDTRRPLTDYEKDTFSFIQHAHGEDIALVQTAFDGEPTAVIAAVSRDGESYVLSPLAVLVTPGMLPRLTDPTQDASS